MANVLTASQGDIYKLEDLVYDTEVTPVGNLKLFVKEQYIDNLTNMGIVFDGLKNGLVCFTISVNLDNLEQLAGLASFGNIMHLNDLFEIYPHLLVNPVTIIPGIMDGAIMLQQGEHMFLVKTNDLAKLKHGIRQIRDVYNKYTKAFLTWSTTARLVKGDNGDVMRFPNGLRVCLNPSDGFARVVIPNAFNGVVLNFQTEEEFYLFIGKRYL